MKYLLPLFAILVSSSTSLAQGIDGYPEAMSETEVKYQELLSNDELKTAVFASGCFWCVEAIYERVKGVKESISGYAGGHTAYPTYESSNTGQTGHAEAVIVFYDPDVISFSQLVEVYFGSQNITQKNGQGPDNGSQYRSILFYQSEDEKQTIDAWIGKYNQVLAPDEVAAEVQEYTAFWLAEDYHQDYERRHPDQSYVQAVSIPRLERFQSKYAYLLKESH